MDYLHIKYLHVTFVVISFCFFLTRLGWSFAGAAVLNKKWVKVTPHVIDTLLLCSAITLVYIGGWSFQDSPWLIAKVVALVFYVVFGSYALKRANTLVGKISFSIFSILIFIYIVVVANLKAV